MSTELFEGAVVTGANMTLPPSEDVAMQPPSPHTDSKEDLTPNASVNGHDASEENADEEMDDLFGNDAEAEDARAERPDTKTESVVETPAESAYDSDQLSQGERERRRALEYLEPDEPGEVVEEVREADVAIPDIPLPQSSSGEHWVIRMPNFVRVDSKPYHPDTYMGPEHDEDDAQMESVREKSMSIKLKVENTVRWRWVKDEFGQEKRQSNSRVIRWSDGSLSLRLGKELFDINQQVDTSGGVARSSLGGSQPSQSQSQPQSQPSNSSVRSQGLTYLVAQHKRSEVLQAETVITGFMSLRPTGMQSETHRMLVRAVGQKHNKVARLRMAPEPTMDPAREQAELARQSAKKSRKKADDGGYGGRSRRRSGYGGGRSKRTNHDVWSDDDEPEYAEGSEDEDDMGMRKRRVDEQKRGPGEYQEDDFVVADESEEDGDFAPPPRPKKKKSRDEDEEEDPLDRLDAKISQQTSDRKRKHRDDDDEDAVGEDAGMDLESEDEEEYKVRKSGSSSRRKRAIDSDDEEEE